MQTPKASKNSSSEVAQRITPSMQTSQKSSPSINQSARQLKVAGTDFDSVASRSPPRKTPKNRSPTVLASGSPRSTMAEKKRPVKLSELQSQLAQLQDELKRTKDQLISSEAMKRNAQEEAEQAKKQLAAMSAMLEESQQQLVELSSTEDARVQELRRLSQERDRAWQSELEAIQNQHSMDSAALTTARNEIQKLKRQLQMVADSEATHSMRAETAYAEIQSLRAELSDTLSMVESMKKELSDCRGSEVHALEVAREAQAQLEATMRSAESHKSEGLKAMEAYNSLALESEKLKAQVSSLEHLVSKLKEDMEIKANVLSDSSKEAIPEQHDEDDGKKEEAHKLKAEIDALVAEVTQLRSALEASELRYQEEYIKSTLHIRNAYDQLEQAKSESGSKEAELQAELEKAKSIIEELKLELESKETMLLHASENNKELSINIEEKESSTKQSELEKELQTLKEDLQKLEATLLDKETEFQSTKEENEMLKAEILKRETERSKANEEAVEAAKAAEREAVLKLGYVTQEADKSSQKAARVAEQLDAAQTANTELEAELRRLKVQSDQWRKAAEAAAAMLSSTDSGMVMSRTVSLDSNYNNTIGAKMGSPLSDDMDDDSPKKKNGNMLKKIGVLWKKGQK